MTERAQRRATTDAIREYLATGGRLFVDPEGSVEAIGGITRIVAFATPPDELTGMAAASHRMHHVLGSPGNQRHVRRVVRSLGVGHRNGCWALEARP